MMRLGSKRPLQVSDLWQLEEREQIAVSVADFEARQRASPSSLLSLLFASVSSQLVFQFACQVLSSVLYLAAPGMLNGILGVIETPAEKRDIRVAYLYATGMLLLPAMRFVLTARPVWLSGRKVGIQLRNVLTALIYRKALRRPASSGTQSSAEGGDASAQSTSASVGKIVNLMAVDAGKIGDNIAMIASPITTFIQIFMCVGCLILLLGWPALIGVGLMTIMVLSGGPLARSLRGSFKALNDARDARANAMNEFVQGIRVIKFFAWESKFAEKINVLRETELSKMFIAFLLGSLNRVFWYSTPIIVSISTFLAYTKIAERDLTASVAFTSLALFNLIRMPLQVLPDTIVQLMDAWVSFTRVRDFLGEPELDDIDSSSHGVSPNTTAGDKIGLVDGEFAYATKKEQADALSSGSLYFRLYGVNVLFPRNKLSVVVGATGSGKSSLLMALLGEMDRLAGYRHMPSSTGIAYASQQAWLTNATIRDNITFGQPYDADLYARVVFACALTQDFASLEGGDMTEVGEKGVNLSGGQKQRISLARACYNPSPLIVLDDPLSAVDAPTARHIFDNCIRGVLAGRSVILVTNALSLCLPSTDFLVVVEKGTVAASGDVLSVLSALESAPERSPFIDNVVSNIPSFSRDRLAAISAGPLATSIEAPAETRKVIDGSAAKIAAARLIQDEGMSVGRVSADVYKLYYMASGGALFYSVLLGGYALNHALAIGQDNWMRIWTQAYTDIVHISASALSALTSFSVSDVTDLHALAVPSTVTVLSAASSANSATVSAMVAGNGTVASRSAVDVDYYLGIYALIGLCTIIAISARLVLSLYGNIYAGRNLHAQLFNRIRHAPMRFFETTPVGRLLNRFTKDVVSCDTDVGIAIGNSMFNAVFILFVLGTITVVVPSFIVGLVPVAYGYIMIGRYYIQTSRSLKRLDSVAKSPIFSHFSESINGVTTIRAYGQQERFTVENARRVDDFNRANYALFISSQWLNIRIQLAGAFVVFASGLAVISSGVNAGFAGLCLSMSLSLTDVLIALVRMVSFLEMSMNSVERVEEYLHVEQEAAEFVPEAAPPAGWPHAGAIDISGLTVKYAADGPDVLKDLSVSIAAGQKVGVVGRTGAGKSTLTLALYRFMEPSAGSITIDGHNVCRMGLHDLRSGLTIIPQDPILFSGTVRYNLDPFGLLPDADLWAALRRSHLVDTSIFRSDSGSTVYTEASSVSPLAAKQKTSIDGLVSPQQQQQQFSITLDTMVSEGGSNFSQGQRQLLCLARALSRRSKIILLDEATASVDAETDTRIQQTIRSEFAGSTVITIAHRLRTIADFDRVLVLDGGRLVQFGSPSTLVRQPGVFRSMCEETGEFDELVEIAESAREIRVAEGQEE
ncbi:P-loop containing nucleoside triphosphate hydrolase protein [Entophlyctis helioformis]|nr:P-loop containing nucleoside triphosphate hydrolase protein [Entophlyctis helioformis]